MHILCREIICMQYCIARSFKSFLSIRGSKSRDEATAGRCFRLPFFLYHSVLMRARVSHLARFETCRCDVTRMRYVTGLLGTLRGTVGIRGRVPTTQAVPPDMPVASFGTSRTRYCLGLIMFTSESREHGYNHVYHASRSRDLP